MDNNLNQTPSGTQPTLNPVTQASPISSVPQSPLSQTTASEVKNGSKMKIIIALVIVLVILGGLGFFGYSYFITSKVNLQGTTNVNNLNKNTANQVKQDVVNSTVTDTSNAQIDKDLQSIDQGLNNTDANAAAVDQGFNDQQTNLQ